MKRIATTAAPAAIGPYSQAINAGNLVFVSGQVPLDPETGKIVEGGIRAQTRRALINARHILLATGVDMGHVVKTTVFLANMADFAAVNEEYALFFSEPYPARSAVAVSALPKGALVEIECVAEL